MKIATKISLGIMTSVMSIALIMAILMHVVSLKILDNNYSEMMINSVIGKGFSVEESLGHIQDSLTVISDVIESDVSYTNIRSEKFIDNYIKSIETLLQSTAKSNKALSIYFYINPDFYSEVKGSKLADLDNQGTYKPSTLVDLKRVNFNSDDMTWYSQGVIEKEYWSKPYYWRPWDKTLISFTKTLHDSEGHLLGLLGIDMDYQKITSLLSDIKIFKTGYFGLLDSGHNVIYHPDSQYIGKNIREIQGMGPVIKEFSNKNETGFIKYVFLKNKKGMAYHKLSNNWIVFNTVEDKDFLSNISLLKRNFLYVVIIITLISTLISRIFARAFSRPILEAVEKIKTGAVGDLSVRIDSMTNDEINVLINSFNFFMDKLDHLFTGIKQEAQSVEATAEEMNLANEELAKKASEQASALEENTSTMKQINALVITNTERTMQADIMAQNVVENTHSIEDASAGLKNAMSDITESSRQIEDIIEIIDEIAFQTNILSLNAAVEAARAGEQGRGFAVVASEIRTLSKKSSASAKKIKQRIKHSVEKVEEGDKLVTETIKYLSTITHEIEDISNLICSIRESAQEQKQAVEQVYSIIGNLESATQSNASIAEETSSSMTMFYEKIKTFFMQIDKFKVTNDKDSDAHAKK